MLFKEAQYSLICGKDKQSYWIVSGKVLHISKTTEATFIEFGHIIDKMFMDILVYIEHVSVTTKSVFKIDLKLEFWFLTN